MSARMEKRLWTLYKDVRSTSWKGAGSSIIVLTSISLESSSSRSSSRACMNMYALNPSNLFYSVQLCLHVCVYLEPLFMATPKRVQSSGTPTHPHTHTRPHTHTHTHAHTHTRTSSDGPSCGTVISYNQRKQ